MSLIKREVVFKEKEKTTHPWERTLKSEFLEKGKRAHNSIKNPQYPKKKDVSKKGAIQFEVIGNRFSKEFIYCANLLKGLHKYKSKTFASPIIKGVTGVEWQSLLNDIRLRFGGESYCEQNCRVIILINGQYFGGHKELKKYIEKRYVYNLCLNYHKEAIAEFCNFISTSRRPFVYMHFDIDKQEIGPMIFMMYSDLVPNTCKNFMRLCKERRGGYPGSPVHRIVKEGWIQCGGFGLKGAPELSCENFNVPLDKRGVLAMCNDGRNVECSTQFFVLLQPAPWMKHKYVAFGQLVEGEGVLSQIENTPTWNESPTKDIIITKAGVLNIDCRFSMINQSTQLYLDMHTEDLVSLGELLMETLMLRVFAKVDAIEAEQSSRSRTSSISSYDVVEVEQSEDSEKKEKKGEKKDEKKEKETTERTVSSIVKEKRPFYLAFTNVPYPDEYDSDFDTKRFLQGNYCLETDLTIDLPKDEKQHTRIIIPTGAILSEMNLYDELKGPGDEGDALGDMDSSEEEELRNYIKDNVERASFAGGVIRNICKGTAMPNLFEGARKSELINEEDVKKLKMQFQFQRRVSTFDRRQSMAARKSEVISDETVRKLRRLSLFERRVSQAARKSELPGLDLERLNKIAEERDKKALEEKRQHEENEKKTKAGKKGLRIALPDGGKTSSAEDEEEDEDEDSKQRTERTVSLVPQTRGKTASKIMRRPTGYLHKEDVLEILRNKKIKMAAMGEQMDEIEEEEFADMPAKEPVETVPSRDEKQRVRIYDPNESDHEHKGFQRRPTGFIKPEDLKFLIHAYEQGEKEGEMSSASDMEQDATSAIGGEKADQHFAAKDKTKLESWAPNEYESTSKGRDLDSTSKGRDLDNTSKGRDLDSTSKGRDLDSTSKVSKHADSTVTSSGYYADTALTSKVIADTDETSSKRTSAKSSQRAGRESTFSSSKPEATLVKSSKQAESTFKTSDQESALEAMEQDSIIDPFSDPLFERMIEMLSQEPDAELPTLKNYKSQDGPNFFLSTGNLQRSSKKSQTISTENAAGLSKLSVLSSRIKGDLEKVDKTRRGKRKLSLSRRPLDDYKITKYTLTVEEYRQKNIENYKKMQAEQVKVK